MYEISTVGQFVELVKNMRQAQKEYEKRHLDRDKFIKEELEKKVDQAIKARETRLLQEELDKEKRLF